MFIHVHCTDTTKAFDYFKRVLILLVEISSSPDGWS